MKHHSPPARLRRRILLAGCISLWVGAFVVTHIPASQLPSIHVSDRTLHAVGFFALASIFGWTLRAHGHQRLRRVLLVLVLMTIYAAVDELTQPLVNRYAAWSDWFADVLGAVAAVLVWEITQAAYAGLKGIKGRRAV
ncbi:MAG: VanZ family protein [Phycisphaerae bacterium]|nr:VanZ family protein [Phycisphaerae bacterium]